MRDHKLSNYTYMNTCSSTVLNFIQDDFPDWIKTYYAGISLLPLKGWGFRGINSKKSKFRITLAALPYVKLHLLLRIARGNRFAGLGFSTTLTNATYWTKACHAANDIKYA